MADDDVTKKRGISLPRSQTARPSPSIRAFTISSEAYERQNGRCGNGTHCLTPGNGDGQQVFGAEFMNRPHDPQ